MGKLFIFTVLATLFAFGVSEDLPSALEGRYTSIDEAKLSSFTKIGQKYYMIEAELKLSWYGAAHFCRRMDAQLATFETEEEWQELSSYLISNGYTDKHFFWLSGNSLDTLKDFYWLSTGQPMNFAKWSTGQPDHMGGNEHCAHLWLQGNEFQMNDWVCEQKAHYICEAANPKTVTITIW